MWSILIDYLQSLIFNLCDVLIFFGDALNVRFYFKHITRVLFSLKDKNIIAMYAGVLLRYLNSFFSFFPYLLNVFFFTNKDNSQLSAELFRVVTNQGQRWIHGTVHIPHRKVPFNYSIVISAFVGGGFTGDIAIDDLTITNCKGKAINTCIN